MGGHDIVQSFKYNFFYYMSARTGYICVQAPGSLGLSDIGGHESSTASRRDVDLGRSLTAGLIAS